MAYQHTWTTQIQDQDELSGTLWDILPEITDTIDVTTNLLNVRNKVFLRSIEDSCENTTVLHRHGILHITFASKKV